MSGGGSTSLDPVHESSTVSLATILSQKVTSNPFKTSDQGEQASRKCEQKDRPSGGLKLSNLTPPGTRKYGTATMASYDRSDSRSPDRMRPTPPASRKHGTIEPPSKEKRTGNGFQIGLRSTVLWGYS